MCRTQNAKNQFLRIIRTPAGSVEFDPTGKRNGRGAYVCGVACLEKAFATHRLDSALRTKVTEEDNERIAAQLRAALSDEDK